MADQEFKRKLTTILYADVKGYSRLMGRDDEGTLRVLNPYMDIISKFIKEYNGRIEGTAGDSVLAKFSSVVDAVNCAAGIQRELRVKNEPLPEDKRIEFRIGINIGDIIDNRSDIHGDGVNIAVRTEELADGGGITITRAVYDQVHNNVDCGFEYIGEHEMKNISEPVRVYRVLMDEKDAGVLRQGKVKKQLSPRNKKIINILLPGIVAVILVATGSTIWNWYIKPLSIVDEIKFDKPSIAVLPFTNMSRDPDQEYFSDGMTDDLITDLSKIRGLYVIARSTVFTYKNKSVKIKEVGRDLGVRYVLEGSVRRIGEKLRINAQLIDSKSGGHVWAERYDGKLDDVFALQESVLKKIVSAMSVKLTSFEVKNITDKKETGVIEAYDLYLKGMEHVNRFTPEDLGKAKNYFQKAVKLDPEYGRAWAGLALTYFSATKIRPHGIKAIGELDYATARLRVRYYLEKGMKNPTLLAYQVSSLFSLQMRYFDRAEAEIERALSSNPNDASFIRTKALIYRATGRYKESINLYKKAMRLDPLNVTDALYGTSLALFLMGKLKEAETVSDRLLTHMSDKMNILLAVPAVVYAYAGREKDARDLMNKYMKSFAHPLIPGSIKLATTVRLITNQKKAAERFARGLHKAGMPGDPTDYFIVLKENRITGDELESLYRGVTLKGIFGKILWNYNFKDNRTFTHTMKNKENNKIIFKDTGRIWFRGDTACKKFKKQFAGLIYCFDTYKNPRGSPDKMNDYIIVNDYASVDCTFK